MSSFWSRNISLSVFGESHGPAIGVVIDNLPPGEYIDLEKLRQFMARRKRTAQQRPAAKRICRRSCPDC